MEKIKTIKEIVASPCNGEVAHFIGTVATKKDKSFDNKDVRVKRTVLLVTDGNYCAEVIVRKKDIPNYDDLVKSIKIGKQFYFEGVVDSPRKDSNVEINLIDGSPNIILKQLEHEEDSLEVRFLKFIYNNDEKSALSFLKENYNYIDLNKMVNTKHPFLSAFHNRMYKLAIAIISNTHFNPNIKDGFGESLFQSLVYIYSYEKDDNENKEFCKKAITLMLDMEKLDVNYRDINDNTALSICAESTQALWILKKLLKFPNIDVNNISDLGEDALGCAISHKNIEAAKLIYASGKVKINDMHKKLAEKYEVDLNEIVPHEFTLADYPPMDDRLSNEALKSSGRLK